MADGALLAEGETAHVVMNSKGKARALPPETKRLVSGRIERFGARLQMVHPDYILPPDQADNPTD